MVNITSFWMPIKGHSSFTFEEKTTQQNLILSSPTVMYILYFLLVFLGHGYVTRRHIHL